LIETSYSPWALTYSLNMLIRRPRPTTAETLGVLNGPGPNGQYFVANTQPTPLLKGALGCTRKMRRLKFPIRTPLQVLHLLVVTLAIQIRLFGLQTPRNTPSVVKTTRRPIRFQRTAQSAMLKPANPGRTARMDDGLPKTRVARLSVGLRIDHGPIDVTCPRFVGDPPDTRIVMTPWATAGNASTVTMVRTRLNRLIRTIADAILPRRPGHSGL
jgi:hypothetical protein